MPELKVDPPDPVDTDGLLLPNLIIPGVQKCATTSMHAILGSHPACCMSRVKESNFFSVNWNRRSLREYSDECFLEGGPVESRVFGESSTTYFQDSDVPFRLRRVLGSAVRILILLRNPVDRAISAYWHMVKRAAERRSPEEVFGALSSALADAVADETEALRPAKASGVIDTQNFVQLTGDEFWNFQYIRNSCYVDCLQRFESVFGSGQVLVVLSEELRAEPLGTMRRVAQFLEIDVAGFDFWYRLNTTIVPKQNRSSRFVNAFAQRLPGGPLRRARELLLSATSAPPKSVSRSVRRRLQALFRTHNEQLAGHLRRDLSVWNG